MPTTLALVTDLIFSTRIASTAEGLGVSCRIVRSLADVEAALDDPPDLAVIDLTADDGVEAVSLIKRRAPAVRVVAFAPHVDTASIEGARAGGADDVMARSAFVRRLAELLAPDAISWTTAWLPGPRFSWSAPPACSDARWPDA